MTVFVVSPQPWRTLGSPKIGNGIKEPSISMFYFIYSTVIFFLFWKIKKCILTFLYNTIHQYYHNVQIKCIWPVLQQNLNMFLHGIYVKYFFKKIIIHPLLHSVNKYLFSTCHVSGPRHWVGIQGNVLAFIELKFEWYYQRPALVFRKTFEYICQMFFLNRKIHWEFFLNFILNISVGKWQKQDFYLMEE